MPKACKNPFTHPTPSSLSYAMPHLSNSSSTALVGVATQLAREQLRAMPDYYLGPSDMFWVREPDSTSWICKPDNRVQVQSSETDNLYNRSLIFRSGLSSEQRLSLHNDISVELPKPTITTQQEKLVTRNHNTFLCTGLKVSSASGTKYNHFVYV